MKIHGLLIRLIKPILVKVCLKGLIGQYLCSYLWHDVPSTALVRPSINVTSTDVRFNNRANSWGSILSSDGCERKVKCINSEFHPCFFLNDTFIDGVRYM